MRSTPVRPDANTTRLPIPSTPTSSPGGLGRRAGIWFLHELYEILPPTIFFVVGFNLVVLMTNLILAQYSVAFVGFLLATAAALAVGKFS